MKKLTTYLLSTGCIIAAAMAMSAVASAEEISAKDEAAGTYKPVQINKSVEMADYEEGEGDNAKQKNVAVKGYDSIDDAIAAITKAKGTDKYVLTLKSEYLEDEEGFSVGSKFALPKTASSVTIISGDKVSAEEATETLAEGSMKIVTVDASGAASIAANCDFILDGISLTGGTATKFTAKGNVTLKDGATMDTFGSVKGAKDKTFTFDADQVINYDFAGFGTVLVPAGKTLSLKGGAKKGPTFSTLELKGENSRILVYDKAVTIDTLKGPATSIVGFVSEKTVEDDEETSTTPANIILKKDISGAKTIQIAYYVTEGALGEDGETMEWTDPEESTFPSDNPIKIITNGAKSGELAKAFKLSETAADSNTYTISTSKKDSYVQKIVFNMNNNGYANWSEVTSVIEKANKSNVAYTVTVTADADVNGALKMPKKGTYKSLTIVGGTSSSGSSGSEVTETYTVFTNSSNNTTKLSGYFEAGNGDIVKVTRNTATATTWTFAELVASIPSGYTANGGSFSYTYTVSSGSSGSANRKLAFTGGISGTGDLTLDTLTLKSYKYDKKSGTKNGVATALSTKGSLYLKNVTMDSGTFVTEDGEEEPTQTETATTLKTISADNLYLYDGSTAEAAAIKATNLYGYELDENNKIVNTGSVTLAANSIAIKGSAVAEKITIDPRDKKDPSQKLSDLSKYKVTIGTLSADIADIINYEYDDDGEIVTVTVGEDQVNKIESQYSFAYSGKALVPVAWTLNEEQTEAVSCNVIEAGIPTTTTEDDGNGGTTSTTTIDPIGKFVDWKSVSNYLATAAKDSKTSLAKKTIQLTLGTEAPAKFALPKAGTYSKLIIDGEPTEEEAEEEGAEPVVTPLTIEAKSLKLTGNLETTENVYLKVTKLTAGSYKFVDGYANAVKAVFVAAYDEVVGALASGKYVDGADGLADKITAAEAAAETEGLDKTDKTVASDLTKLEAIKAASEFVADSGFSASGTANESIYEAWSELDKSVKAYLSATITRTKSGDDYNYAYAPKE